MSTTTKTDPWLQYVRRAMALEGQAANPAGYGVTTANDALKGATAAYRAKYLAGFDIPQNVQTQAGTVAPDTTKTRADLEGSYAGSVDPNSPDYVDPSNILQLVGQRMQGGKDYLSRVTNAVGNLWDKGVQASRFGVEDANAAADAAAKTYGDASSRARALIDSQRQREEGLTDYEKKAQIDARYAKGSAGNTITLEDALKNPGTLGLYSAGVTKVQKKDGGFDFIDDATGKAIPVEEVQARIPGSSVLDFLKGSSNQQDVARLNPQTPSQAKDQSTFNYFADQIRANPKKKKGIIAEAKKAGYVYLINDLTQL